MSDLVTGTLLPSACDYGFVLLWGMWQAPSDKGTLKPCSFKILACATHGCRSHVKLKQPWGAAEQLVADVLLQQLCSTGHWHRHVWCSRLPYKSEWSVQVRNHRPRWDTESSIPLPGSHSWTHSSPKPSWTGNPLPPPPADWPPGGPHSVTGGGAHLTLHPSGESWGPVCRPYKRIAAPKLFQKG